MLYLMVKIYRFKTVSGCGLILLPHALHCKLVILNRVEIARKNVNYWVEVNKII